MSGPSAPACPRCSAPLRSVTATDAVAAMVCNDCGGAWLDNQSASRIAEGLGVTMASVIESRARANSNTDATSPSTSSTTPSVVSTAAEIVCPGCTTRLSRVSLASVDIDLCETHGTWFDHGELTRIADMFHEKRKSKARPGMGAAAAGTVGAAALAAVALSPGMQDQLTSGASSIAQSGADMATSVAEGVIDIAADVAPDLLIGAASGGIHVAAEVVASGALEVVGSMAGAAVTSVVEAAPDIAGAVLSGAGEIAGTLIVSLFEGLLS